MGQFDATYTVMDARTMYCPQAFGDMYGRGKCVANECMAWRWEKVTTPIVGVDVKGYCGLAGKPK